MKEKDITWFEQNGRKIHYKVKQKIIRLVQEEKYFQLGVYVFKEIFKDDLVKNKREKYIGETPQKTYKTLEYNLPKNLEEGEIIKGIDNFISKMRVSIFHDQLEP